MNLFSTVLVQMHAASVMKVKQIHACILLLMTMLNHRMTYMRHFKQLVTSLVSCTLLLLYVD